MYEVAYLKRKIGNIQLIKITREHIGSNLADLKTGPVQWPQKDNRTICCTRVFHP